MGLLLILLSWVTQLEVREEREEVENSWGKGERETEESSRGGGGAICVHVGVDTLILVCVRGRDTIKEKEWRRLEGGRETRRHAAAACTCVFFCVCFWCAAQTAAQRLKKYDSSRRPADHQTDASDHSTESLSLRGNEDKCDTDSV